MRFLITAGNTQTPIDRVRCLTTNFTGRTGGRIALEAIRRGHDVCLLTSHPESVEKQSTHVHFEMRPFRTFDDLHELMSTVIPPGGFDAIVHSAAVSDYLLAGVYASTEARPIDGDGGELRSPSLIDAAAGKVKSTHPELWLQLLPAPKLIDSIRQPWGFSGILVKFKLEVGLEDDTLLQVAEASRQHSKADLMVANTLDGMADYAYLGPLEARYERVERTLLASRLIDAIEVLQAAPRD